MDDKSRPIIFVFGSNLAGCHGAGAALHARCHYGAIYGRGSGRQGSSYAIPTKDAHLKVLPLATIAEYVRGFLVYAGSHPELKFQVTRIGCGLAGYDDTQIAPFFAGAPHNCDLPDGWRNLSKSECPDIVPKLRFGPTEPRNSWRHRRE